MSRSIPGGVDEDERIACIGDSLTSVYPNTPYDHYPRYLAANVARPGRLATMGSVHMGGYKTEGHSGFTTAGILAALSGYMALWVGDPTRVPILLGVNDEIVDGLTGAQTVANLIAIRAAVLARYPRARVPVCTLLPVGAGAYFASRDPWIATVNPLIRAGIEDVCDLNVSGFNPTTMTSDGLHTNTLGAQFVAPLILAHMGIS